MMLPPETADRLRLVAATLDRYIARETELVAEVEKHKALAAAADGYVQMKAENEVEALTAKIALYRLEIELLRSQTERMTGEAVQHSNTATVISVSGE